MRFDDDANREAAAGLKSLTLLTDNDLVAEYVVGKLHQAHQLKGAYALCSAAVEKFPAALPLRVQRISLGIESKLAPDGQTASDLSYVADHAPEGDERRQWAKDLLAKKRA
jgi:hypothetical protein